MISKDSIDMGGDTEWEKVEGHRNVEAAATRGIHTHRCIEALKTIILFVFKSIDFSHVKNSFSQ